MYLVYFLCISWICTRMRDDSVKWRLLILEMAVWSMQIKREDDIT